MSKEAEESAKELTVDDFPSKAIRAPDGREVQAVEARYMGPGALKFNGSPRYKKGDVGVFPRSTVKQYLKRASEISFLPPDADWDGSKEAKEESEAAAAAEAEALLERDAKEGAGVPAVSGDEGTQGGDPAAEAGE